MVALATIVVALGGNAIAGPTGAGTFEQQYAQVDAACAAIAGLVQAGHRVAVTHGNGPQVGNILLQNERCRDLTPPMPLDACGAQSQGLLGYMFQQALRNRLRAAGVAAEVATLVTQTEVDPADPAFSHPTKPIGPFYTEEQARALMAEQGVVMREDAGRGWRRVVPSPEPRGIVEKEAIRRFLAEGWVVVACGGGGVPVVRAPDGRLVGVEAVIDKDLAAERLAEDVGADRLLILTDVDRVYLHYGRPEQRPLERMTVAEGRRYQREGHFGAGSMGPKVEAALRFAESGRGTAAIGPLAAPLETLEGRTGTRVVP